MVGHKLRGGEVFLFCLLSCSFGWLYTFCILCSFVVSMFIYQKKKKKKGEKFEKADTSFILTFS